MANTRRALSVVLATALLSGASHAGEGAMDVSVRITPSMEDVLPGDEVTMLVEVTNGGPDPGAMTIDLQIDGDVVLTPPTPGPGVTCYEVDRCVLAGILPGEVAVVTVTATPLTPGPLEHRASAEPSLPDPAPDDNLAVQITEVTGEACTQNGTLDDDVLEGTPGPDVLCGLGGDDTITGLGGDDELRGGSGEDSLDGGPGDDMLTGGDGQDTASFATSSGPVSVDLGAGTAVGDGTDSLSVERAAGSPFDDVIVGGPAPGVLSGSAGTDLLFAGPAGDRLEGGEGDDYLEGAGGADDLDGGPGTNTCRWDGLDTATACLTSDPEDGNDVRGKLDLRGVDASLDPEKPRWWFLNRKRIRRRALWDKGYFVVALDTKEGGDADYFGVGRATRRRWRGVLITASGRTVRRITVKRHRSRTLGVRLLLPSPGQGRSYYRWWVISAWTGKRCGKVCLDRIPQTGAMVEPRL